MSRTDGSPAVDPQQPSDHQPATGDDRALALGAGVGLLAWLAGYVLTYVVVAPDVRESDLNRIIELFGGEPATRELVGWVFYNAHLVDTVFRNLPGAGSETANYVGGDGFTVLLYAVPLVTLVGSGLLLARLDGATTPSDGAVAGLTALPGYFVPSLAGVFLFEVTVQGVSGAPDLITGVAVAGVAYPLVCAGLGGGARGLFADGPTAGRRRS